MEDRLVCYRYCYIWFVNALLFREEMNLVVI